MKYYFYSCVISKDTWKKDGYHSDVTTMHPFKLVQQFEHDKIKTGITTIIIGWQEITEEEYNFFKP